MRTMMIDELEMVTGGTEPMIKLQEVEFYDQNGTKYVISVKEQELPDVIDHSVSYSDGNGNQFIVK